MHNNIWVLLLSFFLFSCESRDIVDVDVYPDFVHMSIINIEPIDEDVVQVSLRIISDSSMYFFPQNLMLHNALYDEGTVLPFRSMDVKGYRKINPKIPHNEKILFIRDHKKLHAPNTWHEGGVISIQDYGSFWRSIPNFYQPNGMVDVINTHLEYENLVVLHALNIMRSVWERVSVNSFIEETFDKNEMHELITICDYHEWGFDCVSISKKDSGDFFQCVDHRYPGYSEKMNEEASVWFPFLTNSTIVDDMKDYYYEQSWMLPHNHHARLIRYIGKKRQYVIIDKNRDKFADIIQSMRTICSDFYLERKRKSRMRGTLMKENTPTN